MVMYKIDRRGGGAKNHILGQTLFLIIGHVAAVLGPESVL